MVRYLDPRRQLIVANVSYGWDLPYEADLVVVRPSGHAIEIELKVSRADIRADANKGHGHCGRRFQELWFAVPALLGDYCLEHIRDGAGLFVVGDGGGHGVAIRRRAKPRPYVKSLTAAEELSLLRLGMIRLWTLKHHRSRVKVL